MVQEAPSPEAGRSHPLPSEKTHLVRVPPRAAVLLIRSTLERATSIPPRPRCRGSPRPGHRSGPQPPAPRRKNTFGANAAQGISSRPGPGAADHPPRAPERAQENAGAGQRPRSPPRTRTAGAATRRATAGPYSTTNPHPVTGRGLFFVSQRSFRQHRPGDIIRYFELRLFFQPVHRINPGGDNVPLLGPPRLPDLSERVR